MFARGNHIVFTKFFTAVGRVYTPLFIHGTIGVAVFELLNLISVISGNKHIWTNAFSLNRNTIKNNLHKRSHSPNRKERHRN